MKIREFCDSDVEEMIEIWNEIVEDGIAFPQEDILDLKSGHEFFSSQTYTGVAILDEKIVGLYILHPNNVGRCSHIANASYAVSSDMRGKHIGERLVLDSLKIAKARGFLILQYNAVVETNYAARHLYEKLGFKQLGIIPKGFKTKDNRFENICPYYIEL
ncbi:MAG: GNAT family N-acetyltransferase [Methanobrevibacter sp.]|nr:GNAT family N-acetyltransferase [Methanobrevibacter sp.]